MSVWAGLVTAFGTVGAVVAGVFAARATTRAAHATAEATQAAARLQAEPNQRQADLAAFRAIRDDMEGDIRELRQEQNRLRTLVHAFSLYVADLTSLMHQHRITPPAPPERLDEYNRTGV
ncbi:hypothetical protein ACL02U_13225 [Streptomyces sp. MS06]|uniref:hypothetical protein n=1 Tax=Streptomyces sp. MS06 TaxID=3385974 RepID=UPI0039A24AD6